MQSPPLWLICKRHVRQNLPPTANEILPCNMFGSSGLCASGFDQPTLHLQCSRSFGAARDKPRPWKNRPLKAWHAAGTHDKRSRRYETCPTTDRIPDPQGQVHNLTVLLTDGRQKSRTDNTLFVYCHEFPHPMSSVPTRDSSL
jgi:hypothetical protein